MKKMFLLVFICVFLAGNAYSQISFGGTPLSIEMQKPADDEFIKEGYKEFELSELDPYIITADFNWDEIFEEDEYYNRLGMPMRTGFSIDAGLNPNNSGTWEVLPCGTLLWRLKIESPGAKSLSLLIDDFNMPQNARLFVYEPDQNHIIGAFNSNNNTPEGIFNTHLLPGSTVIVEYEQYPDKSEAEPMPSEDFRFNIESLLYNYLSNGVIDESKDLGNAGACNVNINCPEGDQWQNEKRGVARMKFKVGSSWYWCTGSLVNNTNQDGTPYFLTADHCGGDASAADRNQWQFYFNYERSGCGNTGNPPNNMLTGASKKASAPIADGSDFQLVTLNNNLPASYSPYYNGWSRLTGASNSGVSIHHPSGDAKKISTYTEGLSSATVTIGDETMASNSSWRVTWVETQSGHGVTEGGSSGSPIFNSSGQVVGALVGGSSSCSSTGSPDFYGKFDYHWDKNGNTNDSQLKPWLDPANTGAFTLNGYDPYNDIDENIILNEIFEGGSLPSGWTQEQIIGNRNWSFGVGNDGSNPDYPQIGSRNAYFRITSGSQFGYTARLITPPMNLPSGSSAKLSFFLHNQVWDDDQDILRIYYKNATDGEWTMIGGTSENLDTWTYHSYNLPNPSATYYIAFHAIARWGYGVCVDNVKVELPTETDEQEGDKIFVEAFPNPATDLLNVFVNSQSDDYQILIMDMKGSIVYSNSFGYGTKHNRIDVSGLSKGMYLVKVSAGKLDKTLKFVKTE